MFARFSTVGGGAGSVGAPLRMRGFAVRLYTQQGSWDLVGNDVPVFFIQDAMKLPDVVHSVEKEPDCGFPRSLRMIEGIAVHSFRLIDERGASTMAICGADVHPAMGRRVSVRPPGGDQADSSPAS